MFNTISIIGCGLIGSSILRAISLKNLAKKIKVFDFSKDVSAYLKKENLCQNVTNDIPAVKIDAGAPSSTRVRSTVRTAPALRPIMVVSFPSDQVPAPPSPQQRLLSGRRIPRTMSAPISRPRCSTPRPRSRTVTWAPPRAKPNAAKYPAGPAPTTTT